MHRIEVFAGLVVQSRPVTEVTNPSMLLGSKDLFLNGTDGTVENSPH